MSFSSISTTPDFDEYATLAAAEAGVVYDTTKLGFGKTVGVLCLSAGSLVVKKQIPGQGVVTQTITVVAGFFDPIEILGIVAAGSTGCVPIRVYRPG